MSSSGVTISDVSLCFKLSKDPTNVTEDSDAISNIGDSFLIKAKVHPFKNFFFIKKKTNH